MQIIFLSVVRKFIIKFLMTSEGLKSVFILVQSVIFYKYIDTNLQAQINNYKAISYSATLKFSSCYNVLLRTTIVKFVTNYLIGRMISLAPLPSLKCYSAADLSNNWN